MGEGFGPTRVRYPLTHLPRVEFLGMRSPDIRGVYARLRVLRAQPPQLAASPMSLIFRGMGAPLAGNWSDGAVDGLSEEW